MADAEPCLLSGGGGWSLTGTSPISTGCRVANDGGGRHAAGGAGVPQDHAGRAFLKADPPLLLGGGIQPAASLLPEEGSTPPPQPREGGFGGSGKEGPAGSTSRTSTTPGPSGASPAFGSASASTPATSWPGPWPTGAYPEGGEG